MSTMFVRNMFHNAVFTTSLITTTLCGSLFAVFTPPASAMSNQASHVTLNQVGGINREAALALAIVGGAAIGIGLSHQKQKSSPNSLSSKDEFHATNAQQRQLLRLLHEDKAAASRLLTQAEVKYPGRTSNWYVEKVIYDLERDRGRI